MNLIEKSLDIALSSHKGQKDKAGETYILHPLRVMSKMETEKEMSVAILHDVIEDSEMTSEDLLQSGIPEIIVDALICLTKNRNALYEEFIDRICLNDLARKIKIADIQDNINILRLTEVADKDLDRVVKYHKAWRKLTQNN